MALKPACISFPRRLRRFFKERSDLRRCVFRRHKPSPPPFFLQVDTFADDAFHAAFSVAQWEEGVGLCLAFLSPPLSGAPDRWHDITGQAGSTMQRSCGPLI